VTWLDANTNFNGVVSAANSLVGGTAGDRVGSEIGVVGPVPLHLLIGSPNWTNPATNAANAGALTYVTDPSGLTGVVGPTNSLVGTHANDRIGGGVGGPFIGFSNLVFERDLGGPRITLQNNNMVVRATGWNSGRGAVTFVAAGAPLTGEVSDANSLVGGQAGDQVGLQIITVIAGTSNYLVRSPSWANGGAAGAGALTWGSGTTGVTGVVGPTNSLVGATAGDNIGGGSITVLTNGNFVHSQPSWDNGSAVDAGAVTWLDATGATVGVVSALNSVVGASTNDRVGRTSDLLSPIVVLPNGNYVIATPTWRNAATSANFAGAVTWVNGATGKTTDGSGVISIANSLIGDRTNELIGSTDTFTVNGSSQLFYTKGIRSLGANGNYVVLSSSWDNGAATSAGAVTWVNGATGETMNGSNVISATNSIVGTNTDDRVGERAFGSSFGSGRSELLNGVRVLANGNYIVESNWWNGSRGAVTWGNGATGTAGAVGPANSLVGSTFSDSIGQGIDPSTNFANPGVIVIPNTSNVFVLSPVWDNGAAVNAGAITFINGTTGLLQDGAAGGAITAANSLIGQRSGDLIGLGASLTISGGTPSHVFLANGRIAFINANWANGAAAPKAGAVTVMDPASPVVGFISAANSLVGTQANDAVGVRGIDTRLRGGFYVVLSPDWANGAATRAGAVTVFHQDSPPVGAVSALNSVVGSHVDDFVGAPTINLNPVLRLERNQPPPNDFLPDETFANFLIFSDRWNGNRGAVTMIVVNGTSWSTLDGTNVVGPTNSIVGGFAGDRVGSSFRILSNATFYIPSPSWNGNRGAVTWSSGENPGIGIINTVGVVSELNSLVGSTPGDRVGSGFIAVDQFGTTESPRTFNAFIVSPDWSNGGIANVGAVTFALPNQPIVGVVSAANSIVGAAAGDRVGSGGVEIFGGFDRAYIASPEVDRGGLQNVGAITPINKLTGETMDLSHFVSTGNSIVGNTANAALTLIGEIGVFGDPSSSRILARGNGGQLTVGFTRPPQVQTIDFALAPNATMYIPPGVIANLLRGGQNVLLQANTDISLLSPLTVPADVQTDGGRLTLQAGRSVILNASIFTDNGDLVVVANEANANGVDPANRDPGAAHITMGQGATINAGTGSVSLTIAGGGGRSGAAAQGGDITLGGITAAAILAQNLGQGSDVIVNGPIVGTGGGDAVVLATVFGNFINNYGLGAVSAPEGRWLIYSRRLALDLRNGLDSGNPDLVPYGYLTNPPRSLNEETEGGNRYLLSDIVISPPPPPSVPPPPPTAAEGPAPDAAPLDGDPRFDRIPTDGPFAFNTDGLVSAPLGVALPGTLAAIAPAAGGEAGGCAVPVEAWANAYLQAVHVAAAPDSCLPAGAGGAP